MKHENKLKLYIDRKSIDKKVKQIAKQINEDYKDKTPVFIGVLNGAFMFLSDLVKKVKVNLEIDFIRLSSYGQNKVSAGNIKLVHDFNSPISGRDVIVVEDIIDSGLSIKFIYDLLSSFGPSSIEFAALLSRKPIPKFNFGIKYVGFKIPKGFMVGYGLDYAQKYRNLESIYILKN